MKTLLPLVTGSLGVSGVEVVQNVDFPTSTDTSEIIKIVLQVVISLATLLGLFKKKREQTQQN
jgi:hypothetical protein